MERRDYGNLLAEKDTLMKENEEKQQKIEELERLSKLKDDEIKEKIRENQDLLRQLQDLMDIQKEKEIGGNYVEKDIVEEQLEDLAATMVEPNAIGERNEGQPADVADVALSLCSQGLRSEGEGLQDMLNDRTSLRIKRMGEVDRRPFKELCLQKCSGGDWDEMSAKLCSSWEEEMRNPHWHPFKKISVEGRLHVCLS